MSGWTVVDANSNKSLPVSGTQNSGVGVAYTAPSPASVDPVGKFRVSQPQALIDTDFEYGTQPTKWESISIQNLRQSAYYIPQQSRTITAVTTNATNTVVISMADTTGFSVGSLIYVQNSNDPVVNGWFMVSAVSAGVSVSYVTPGTATTTSGNQYSATKTYVYLGYYYSGCGIAVGANAITNVGTVCTATTTNPHGLSAGSLIYVNGTTATTNAPNGAWVVATVPTANTFTFNVINAPTGTITNSANQTTIYARPAGFVESRSFDGGVAFSAGATVPNSQLIRQTRRYFRYQSGKGIQFSTGTSLKPTLQVTSITSSGTTVTVNTAYAHNLAVGCVIQVQGCAPGPYNGTYTIATVPSANSFTYTASAAPGVSPATGEFMRVSPVSWYGSSNRVGMFDLQNGFFFEYDGQTLYAVLRSSVTQINGTVSVTQGSSAVTGTGTQFSTQLAVGDNIVIRGQSYRVVSIASDTSLFISPEYRGTTIAGAIVSRTIETKIPQSQWQDPLNGSGPSGYTLDLTKMQMWYIDYSWYGAGVVRFGLRTTKGQIAYVTQIQNNNIKFEAYMRSGNMAAHYESNGVTPVTTLTATLAAATGAGGVINVGDTSRFAPSGAVKIQAAGQTGAVEYITYSAKTATTLTIAARAQTGGAGSAQTFTYSATAPISVEYASPDTVAALSHWGSSVIMDGNFNDDKSLIFNYGTTTTVSTSSTTPVVLMAIRIAPSVDNGTTGLLGAKEIINRMQLQLESLGIVATGNTYLINLILNGYASGATSGSFVSPVQLTNGVTSSLAQIATNTTNTVTVTGGESVAAAYCQANSVTTLDLGQVRDLGNSILGGGTSNTVPTSQAGFYPDGPDILYVVAQAVSATAGTILARLSWKEAQA